MNIKEFLEKNNLVAIVTFTAIVIGGFLTVDERYAHAGDIETIKKDISMYRVDNEIAHIRQRKSYIDDKVFELQIKKNTNKMTAIESAQLERFQRQLQELTREERSLKEKAK